MDSPALLSQILGKASFSTRVFARKSWRETWTFRRFVPTAPEPPAAVSDTARMPVSAPVVRVRL